MFRLETRDREKRDVLSSWGRPWRTQEYTVKYPLVINHLNNWYFSQTQGFRVTSSATEGVMWAHFGGSP